MTTEPQPVEKKKRTRLIAGSCCGCAGIALAAVLIMTATGGGGDTADDPSPAPTTASETQEPSETTEPAESESAEPAETVEEADPQQWAESIEQEVIANNGGSEWSDLCGDGWCNYVSDVRADTEGNLQVDLQVTPGDPANEQLARNTASFIIISARNDHPELDWVIVNDGTGTIIQQYSPSDFGQ